MIYSTWAVELRDESHSHVRGLPTAVSLNTPLNSKPPGLDCQTHMCLFYTNDGLSTPYNYPQTYPLGEDEFTRATLTLSNDQPQLASEVVFPTASEMFGFSVAA